MELPCNLPIFSLKSSGMPQDLEFNKNEDQFKQLVYQLQVKTKKIKLGGGEKKIEELIADYDDACDYYQFEGKEQAFDWSLLKKSRIEKPFFLGSAIGPTDIKKIKSFSHPDFFGVDINEKFEKTSGVKDLVAVLQFKQGMK